MMGIGFLVFTNHYSLFSREDSIMPNFIKYIAVVPPKTADGLVGEIYNQIKQDFGLVAEPFTIHSVNPSLLAGVWAILRETTVVGTVRREIKEMVATLISDLNRCPWCVDAHSIVVRAIGDKATIGAINQSAPAQDNYAQKVAAWTKATTTPANPVLSNPPFAPDEAAEFIGTVVTFHYLNRMVTVNLSETFLPGKGWLNNSIKAVAGKFYANKPCWLAPL
jgi:AhpD family alkylhydroperoxidase